MTNRTLKYLKEAGWKKDRRVNIDEYIDALDNDGYDINDLVHDFLVSYGGLVVPHPDTRVESRMDSFHFDAKLATECYFTETIAEYMLRIKETVVVVGECRTNHMVILLSHSGRMYAGYESTLIKLGDSVDYGLVGLCEGVGVVGVE